MSPNDPTSSTTTETSEKPRIQRGWNAPIDLKAALVEAVQIGIDEQRKRRRNVIVKRPKFDVRSFPRSY